MPSRIRPIRYPSSGSMRRSWTKGVIRNHIEFFVNDYSLDIGPEGAEAVARLLDMPSATLFRA